MVKKKINPANYAMITNQKCQITGLWQSVDMNPIQLIINKGSNAPSHENKAVSWKLIYIIDNE